VAHACNPSYSGARDQEDCSSKPAWANSSYLKKPISKIRMVEWLKVKALSSNSKYRKKKNTGIKFPIDNINYRSRHGGSHM
jgi:hypothetical protein